MAENPVTARLVAIEKLIDAKNYRHDTHLINSFKKPEPVGIYIISAASAEPFRKTVTDPEKQKATLLEAKNAYEKVLTTSTRTTDPALISLTYVALGKITNSTIKKNTPSHV